MRTHHATLVQLILALILIVTSAFTPQIRIFLLNHLQWVVVVLCITGILYMQTLKAIYGTDKRLRVKIKNQSQLIDTLLVSNSVQSRLIKDIVIPELFDNNTDQFISRLHASGISSGELMNYGIDRKIIAHYELYYYIGKAKEQQDLLNVHKKTNDASMGNASIIKEIPGETDSSAYSLRPVSAG